MAGKGMPSDEMKDEAPRGIAYFRSSLFGVLPGCVLSPVPGAEPRILFLLYARLIAVGESAPVSIPAKVIKPPSRVPKTAKPSSVANRFRYSGGIDCSTALLGFEENRIRSR